MPFAINTTVCIAPEALPIFNLSSFEYATIIKVDEARGRVTLRRLGPGGSWRQKTIDADSDGIVEVPVSEPSNSRLHASRRTLVAFVEDGIIHVGQILIVRPGTDVEPQHLERARANLR